MKKLFNLSILGITSMLLLSGCGVASTLKKPNFKPVILKESTNATKKDTSKNKDTINQNTNNSYNDNDWR